MLFVFNEDLTISEGFVKYCRTLPQLSQERYKGIFAAESLTAKTTAMECVLERARRTQPALEFIGVSDRTSRSNTAQKDVLR